MEILDKIFSYYDKILANLSPSSQALVSLVFLGILIWQIYMIIKSGNWIFIATLILLAPSTWPAAKHIGMLIWTAIKFLLIRAGLAI